jgi:hypothetical protein
MVARATGPTPQYPITLSDGTNTIGIRLPDKTGLRRLPRGQGVERKSARQVTWEGGRGNSRYVTDTTRFYDSGNVWTMVPNQVCPGPLPKITSDNRNHNIGFDTTDSQGTFTHLDTVGKYATSFVVPSGGYTTINVRALLRKEVQSPALYPKLYIYSDVAGAPGTAVWTYQVTSTDLDDTLFTVVGVVAQSVTLTAGATYWFIVELQGADTQVGLFNRFQGDQSFHDGATWTPVAYGPLYHISEHIGDWQAGSTKFFEYKRQMYFVGNREGTATPVMLMNGDRGVASAGTTLTLTDSTKSWATDVWKGSVLVITAGGGLGKYATILSNTGTVITVKTPVNAAASSEYVIVGSDTWTVVSGHGLTVPITSVAVMNDIVYIFQGDSVAARRMREYNSSGTWTREFAADGSNVGDLSVVAPHWDTGGDSMYISNRASSQVQAAKKVVWGTNLTFETAIDVGTRESRITGLTLYNNAVWAGKEDGIWTLRNGKFGDVPIALRAARDERNGVAMIGWNTNLFLSFMSGLERLFGQVVDDIGPDQDKGIPLGRRGYIASMVPAVQYLYIAYDAGITTSDRLTASSGGRSSIMCTTSPGGDWHELFRAFGNNQRISVIFHQNVPNTHNRLWFTHGRDIMYLVLPDDTHNPVNDQSMRFIWEGYLTTAWYDFDNPELNKYFDVVRLISKNLQTHMSIRVDYKVDADGDLFSPNTWTPFPTEATSPPYTSLAVGNGSVTGKRIRFRIVIQSDTKFPAILHSFELRANQMNEIKYDLVFDIGVGANLQLMGQEDSASSADSVIDIIESWKEYAPPLTMRCAMPDGGTLFDNIRGHIDPVSWVTQEWNEIETVMRGNITFIIL